MGKNTFINNNNDELEVNRKNREDYEKLMEESSTNLDGYWDSNNIFVRIFLLILLAVIVVGSFLVISTYIATK